MKGKMKWLMCAALCALCSNQSAYVNTVDMAIEGVNSTAVCAMNTENVVDLQTRAKSALLMDFSTNMVLYSYKPTERLPIASMCKIMTLLLCFDAIEEGSLSLDESICVSERAASMGGSQVFLETNGNYLVKDLIKSIVVASANDACVAMAELICGSENEFVEKMNKKAVALGMDNTNFVNATGLPKIGQYSCAKDVSIMFRELLSYKDYYAFSTIWMDKIAHPNDRFTEISNTNKLIYIMSNASNTTVK